MYFRLAVLVLVWGAAARAVTVGSASLGSAASEQACAITRPGTRFGAAVGQVFFRFVAQGVAAGERLEVEWVSPAGTVASAVPFESLPAAKSLCLLTQLPVGGFAPASQPGRWTVRVASNGFVLAAQAFEIVADASLNAFAVASVVHRGEGAESELVLDGAGFHPSVIVNVAQYQAAGGWQYLHYLFPAKVTDSRITVRVPKLPAGEYIVILKDAAGKLSAPARFVIAAAGGYRLPFRPQDRWVVTQGPYGGFSHWGRSLHAYDLAPVAGSCVVAMRGGVVSAYDLGLGQTPHQRIFGNYITVAHEDGEFSHYAHLRAGSFVAKTGDRVEAGQALARVGTSGYSFGAHVHVHVTKSHWISTPSVPFRFEDAPYRPGFRGAVTSRNGSALGDCSRSATGGALISSTHVGAGMAKPTWSGRVAVADWWHQPMLVARGLRSLSVELGWDGVAERGFDLYLVSPSGRQYNPHADRTGYAAGASQERFTIANPEAGTWRISVQGVKGSGEAMEFWVSRGT